MAEIRKRFVMPTCRAAQANLLSQGDPGPRVCDSPSWSFLSQPFLALPGNRSLASPLWVMLLSCVPWIEFSPVTGQKNARPETLDLCRPPHRLPSRDPVSARHFSFPPQVLTALLSSGLALLGALICFVTSGAALKDGPFCMFDTSSFNQTQAWKYGYPFKDLHSR